MGAPIELIQFMNKVIHKFCGNSQQSSGADSGIAYGSTSACIARDVGVAMG